MERGAIYGNWRAKVVNNKDREKFGRIKVWIPDLMPEVDEKEGLWARPANNPIGGRNMDGNSEHHYMGSSFIPKTGAWVFVFFEGGNINLPYYFGALDLQNTMVLPENQLGSNYEDKWTLLKTHEGRAIVISDDPDDARTEITGKKRKISSPPTGDIGSVYTIDGNQTTILFDEREGKEKILIRTYKGDFLHIDIDEQQLQAYFKSDIIIKTDGDFKLTSKGDIDIKSTEGIISVQADKDNINIKSGKNLSEKATAKINMKAGAQIATDGSSRHDQQGMAENAKDAKKADPKGKRDT